MWLPWFVVSRPQFFFYVLPMTPFMALAAVYTLAALSDARLVLHDDAGEVAIDPETGLPAISTRHPFRPVVVGYLAIFVVAVRLVLAVAGGRPPHRRRSVAGSTSGSAAGTDQRSATAGSPGAARRGGAAGTLPAHDHAASTCAIPMADGVRLAATLYRSPDGDGPWPAVLEALPYRKDDVTASYRPEYQRLAEAGYVMCRVDVRGTGIERGHRRGRVPRRSNAPT